MQAAGNRTLEELKEIRSEAVKLSSRVGKFKSELEDVMQDDSDMLVQPPPPNAPLTLVTAHSSAWQAGLRPHAVGIGTRAPACQERCWSVAAGSWATHGRPACVRKACLALVRMIPM